MSDPGTFDWLLGSWSVEREITDRRAGMTGRFSGTASLTAAGGEEADYVEHGVLHYGDYEGSAERHLRYGRGAGGGIEVRLADGGAYLTMDLTGGACTAVHPCGEDTYEIAIEVRSESCFEERWRVTGPAKDYDAVTAFVRIG